MSDIHLNHPNFLWLLILILPFIFIRIRKDNSRKIPYPTLQFYTKGSLLRKFMFILKYLLEMILFLLLVVAIAEPHQLIEKKMIQEEGLDIALVLDVSASMQASDFSPNRLEVLKKMTSEFIQRSTGNRLGVYIFAQDTFTQTPLTNERSILLELIDSISYGIIDHTQSGGTAIGDALLASSDSLLKSRINNREQVIILITDGENSYGVDPILAARYLQSKNIRLYIIGLAGEEAIKVFVNGQPYITSTGETLVTSLDDTQLKEIASAANGKYYRAKNSNALNAIFHGLSRLEKAPLEIKNLVYKIFYTSRIAVFLFFVFFTWLLLEGFVLRRPIR